ncbi:DUF5667 domain-containing protein [Candidatus Pacebacteria bacterium]|nr:DUF5667 domain-containing protein [Candidatus Paceibacterota bacterium]
MNRETKKFIKDLNALHMDTDAKQSLRTRLSEYADHTPVRETTAASPRRSFIFFLQPAFGAFLIVFILSSAGIVTTQAARGSLPGDVLYPVKVHVYEKAQQVLAFTPERSAEVALAIAKERKRELSIMTLETQLDEGAEKRSREAYVTAIDEAKKRVNILSVTNDDVARRILAALNELNADSVVQSPTTLTQSDSIAPEIILPEDQTTSTKTDPPLDDVSPPHIASTDTASPDAVKTEAQKAATRKGMQEQLKRAAAMIAEVEAILKETKEAKSAQDTLDTVQELIDQAEGEIELESPVDIKTEVRPTTSVKSADTVRDDTPDDIEPIEQDASTTTEETASSTDTEDDTASSEGGSAGSDSAPVPTTTSGDVESTPFLR